MDKSARGQRIAVAIGMGLSFTLPMTQAIAQEIAGLEEVVVTAQKREQTLQDVALAVTAISGAELAAENKTTIAEILATAPGVNIQDGRQATSINIRGVTNEAGPADNPTALYIDGVFAQTALENRSTSTDLKRVEVLRGPQGTLYGGNALGGAVSFISNDPSLAGAEFRYQAAAGNFGLFSGEAVANLPVSEHIAMRFVGSTENRKSYIADTGSSKGFGAKLLKAKVLYQPSEAFNVVLSGRYQETTNGEGQLKRYFGAWENLNDVPNPWQGIPLREINGVKQPSFSKTVLKAADMHVNWDLGFGTVTFLPAYVHVKEDASSNVLLDADPNTGLGTWTQGSSVFSNKRYSGELRLNSEADSWAQWVIGGYYQHHDQPNDSIGILSPGAVPDIFGTAKNTAINRALFGQTTFPLVGELKLTLGGRYSSVRKEEVDYKFSDETRTSKIEQFGHWRDHNVSWRVGLEYKPTDGSLLYANVARGYRSGGLNSAGYLPDPTKPLDDYASMTLIEYSLGSKNEFLDRRLQVNAELFNYRYANYQIQTTNNGVTDTYITEICPHRKVLSSKKFLCSTGGELEVVAAPSPADRITASVSYLHSRFTSNYVDDQDKGIGGSPTPSSPDWTWRAAYTHNWMFSGGARLSAGVDFNYTSKFKVRWEQTGSSEYPVTQEGYHQTNARVAYNAADQRWMITGYIRNIENYAVLTGHSDDGGQTIGPPRVYGATVSYKFDEALH